jgi:hypothetical protein
MEHGTSSRYTNLGCRCDACRAAHSQRTTTYRNAHKTEVNDRRRAKERIRRQLPEYREELNRQHREWYAKLQPDAKAVFLARTHRNSRKSTTGVTDEQWQAALARADNRCESCGKRPETQGLGADHDHDTMEFRGVLCGPCNRGIGLLGDNEEGVAKALDYLRKRVV